MYGAEQQLEEEHAEKMSGQKRSAVAFETNDVPPKKRGVTVETI